MGYKTYRKNLLFKIYDDNEWIINIKKNIYVLFINYNYIVYGG